MSIAQLVAQACRSSGHPVLEAINVPARAQRFAKLGTAPASKHFALTLSAVGIDPEHGLWAHQAESLKAISRGDNLVLSTATASGKSLVFQTAVLAALGDGDGTNLIFYPQKALAADQLHRWQRALEQVGLPSSLVAEINGDVSMAAREQAIADARILLVTPDVIHAWMMRCLAAPHIQNFIQRLRFIVIDEAHALEGPFGSSAAFLLRRLLLAKSLADGSRIPQFIAATATIANPREHLEALTGLSFVCIDERSNGAPRAKKALLHVEAAPQPGVREAQAATLVTALIPLIGDGAIIVFVDSRQGVERITRRINDPSVLPYRSGYEALDRRRIEIALRERRLRAIIATSALELGIDIPQFVVGINLGLPMSRKAFKQRLGRVGRVKPGAFLVMAPANAFTSLGISFADYHAGSVEPSHLYLENRFIQFAQARCLIEEGSAELAAAKLSDWPAGFGDAIIAAKPGGRRPADLDQIAIAGGDCPHLNYPLRQIASESLELRLAGPGGDRIGTIATHQAIREAYPGATYYHLQRPYKVTEWRINSYERSIRLRAVRDAEPTQAILRQWVNGSLNSSEVLGGRLWQAANGNCTEASLQVLESVEGIRSGNGARLYGDLAAENPRMRRQQRDFSTTGVLLQIAEPWFAGSSTDQAARRKSLAVALTELLCRELSISPTEVSWAHTGVALSSAQGPRKADDTIAIYDNIRGGLRLTGPLLELLPAFAARLQRAALIAGAEAMVDQATADRFASWVSSLRAATPSAAAQVIVPDGEVLIFSPGSDVSFRTRGQTYERRIIEPKLIPTPDGDHLFYRYEVEQGVTGWVAHDAVEPLGQDWARSFWNPQTNEVRVCA